MQGRVNATPLEFRLPVYRVSFKRSLTELSVNVQKGHSRHLTRDDDPCKSWYSDSTESTIYLTSNPGGINSWILTRVALPEYILLL